MAQELNADVLIIGCGLSGAVYAHHAASLGKKVIILEKEEELGGCIRSVNYDDGFFTELGAHTIYASYKTIIDMIKAQGQEGDIIPQVSAGYKMLVDGKIVSIFSQLELFKCLIGAIKMMSTPKDGKTVQEYYSKLFGEKNFYKAILPITSAVICQDSSNVSADLLLKSREKDKSVPRSFSLKGGLSSLIKNVDRMGNIQIFKGKAANSVKKINDGFTVNAGGKEISANRLVFAAQPHASADLIEPLAPHVSALLRQLPVHESNAFSIASPVNNTGVKRFGYIISTDKYARSIVSKDTLPHDKYRGFTIHFKEKPADSVLEQYYNLLQIDDAAKIKTASCSFTLPELKLGHHKWRDELIEAEKSLDNIDILGNFFDGLSLEDCAIRAKESAQRAFA